MGIPHTIMDPFEAVFTWIDPDNGPQLHFASDRLAKWAAENCEIVETPVQEVFARMLIADRNLEKHRMQSLVALGADNLPPVLYCEMDRGTHLLVDGNHRYVYACAAGREWIKSYILTREQWEPFLVEGLAPATEWELRTGYSGL